MKNILLSIASKTGLSLKKVNEVSDAIFDAIIAEVAKGKNIRKTGFGQFFSSIRKSRNGVNPQTFEKLVHPEIKIVRFVAGDTFKKRVRG